MPRGPVPGGVRGRYSRVTMEMKQRLIQAYNSGEDYLVAAGTLGIKEQTARSIILRHRNGQPIEDQRGGRRDETVKLSEEVMALLVEMVEQQADITLKSIKEQLANREPPILLSVSSIARGLDRQLITMKKLRPCPEQRNTPRIKQDRAAYAAWYLQNQQNSTLIYVDETCFNLFTSRTRGRGARGQPAVRQMQFERGPNLNLVMAISPGVGVLYYELQRGTMNGERFGAFMDNLATILEQMNAQNPVVVLDNAPVHRGATCGDAIVKFLPAYSPFLNPIENCFSVLKLKIREELRTDEIVQQLTTIPPNLSRAEHRIRVLNNLSTRILDDQDTINGQKVTNMAAHIMTYMHRCSTQQDILL